MSGEARELFAAFIPDGDMGSYARTLPGKLRRALPKRWAYCAMPDFQRLLIEYPRPKRVFLKSYETEDVVSSEWLVRGLDGKEYKPEDYLVAFARFVQENPAKVEAIGILLDRPQDWSTEALEELRRNSALLRNASL